MSESLSLLRSLEYEQLSRITLTGSVLDLGGSRSSGYHNCLKGDHVFTVVNYGTMHPGMDLHFTLEEAFPLADASYDHAVAINVLEHIFNYHNVFQETARVLKPRGRFVIAVPFMHHIHASPDDYHRYTESTFRKLADRYGFEVLDIMPLGLGICSLMYQCVGGSIPTRALKKVCRYLCVQCDTVLFKYLLRYRAFARRIPLGYFLMLQKHA